MDNAATSWPKPAAVVAAVVEALEIHGGSAGRGSHAAAEGAASLVQETRNRLGQWLHCAAERLVFCQNGTEALNLVMLGFVRPGDHVVTTQAEHNSVLRPLRFLQESRGVRATIVPCNSEGRVDAQQLLAAVETDTRLVVMTHVSNVTGAIEPIEAVARGLQGESPALLVDAAQSLGHLPIDLTELPIDFLASSGHKGLLGPLGTGIAYLRQGLEAEVQPLRFGGTGSASDDDRQPAGMPEKYEAGNLDVPALAGLGAAVEFLSSTGLNHLQAHLHTLTERLRAGLRSLSGVRLVGPVSARHHLGPVSFVAEAWDSRELATILDTSFGIQLRAGFHCAARIHAALGSESQGGTLRACPGFATTAADIDGLLEALQEILAEG